MTCELCGREVGTDAALCWRCDLRTFQIRHAVVMSFRPCHGGCGRGVPAGRHYCGQCPDLSRVGS